MDERLELVAEALDGFVYQWDVANDAVARSAGLLEVLGFRADEVTPDGAWWRSRIHPDDLAELLATTRASFADATRTRARSEYRVRCRDGSWRWVAEHARLVRDAAGRVVRVVGITTDVTAEHERRAALVAAQEAERAARAAAELAHQRVAFLADVSERLARTRDVAATLRAIAELAVPTLAEWCFVEVREPDGTIRQLAIVHADPAMIALARESLRRYPIDPDAPFGTGHVLRTGASELAPEIDDAILQSVAQDAEHLAILRAVGFTSTLSVPLRDGDGPPIAVLSLASTDPGRRFGDADLALAEEVARRADAALARARLFEAEHAARAEAEAARADAEEARAQAEAANRAKSQFLATMSHELRTPLNAIGGYAELLELEVHGPVTDAQHEALERIQRSQKHLLGLINEVLNYARIEAGTLRYDIGPVGVAGALATVESLILPQAQAKAIALDIATCDAALQARADAERLRQVLLNLLSNAVKFTERGGRVEVRAARHGDAVVVTVADNGVGIAPDQLERIFEPFVQVGRALNSPGEGTGLGLAISRDLVRGMGGELTASSAPGRGSTFTLRLKGAGAAA